MIFTQIAPLSAIIVVVNIISGHYSSWQLQALAVLTLDTSYMLALLLYITIFFLYDAVLSCALISS